MHILCKLTHISNKTLITNLCIIIYIYIARIHKFSFEPILKKSSDNILNERTVKVTQYTGLQKKII